ncbi:hypothetical protein GXM_06369 [Nostoc sphaeroides CCNUC1]|uniref:Uncharacterized protein n=1 Tax=Nostoc sphaeroides CCNUC1 TaxID=2653204 RepID=A0A5P8W7Y7_9NOSO|nr:hypothetical protein GXM_06369 [Nostoc sphaeroides CCNUC1]
MWFDFAHQPGDEAGLFDSHLARLRIYSEANSTHSSKDD